MLAFSFVPCVTFTLLSPGPRLLRRRPLRHAVFCRRIWCGAHPRPCSRLRCALRAFAPLWVAIA